MTNRHNPLSLSLSLDSASILNRIKEGYLIWVSITPQFLVSVAWEGKLISNTHCEQVALKLEEIGKMLGGWKKSLENPEKKNRNP